MLSDEKYIQFSTQVLSQVRCKKVHAEIEQELSAHIEDQKEAYQKQGMDDKEALSKAITSMGDPIIVGGQLDRIHRPQKEWSLLFLFGAIFAIGALYQAQVAGLYFKQHILYSCIGLIFFILAYFTDYQFLGKYALHLYAFLLIFTLFFMPFTTNVNGMPYFIAPSFSFRVSYMLLLIIPLYGGILYRFRGTGCMGILGCGILYFLPLPLASSGGLFLCFLYTLVCLSMPTAAITKGFFQTDKKKALFLVYIPVFFLCLFFFFFFLKTRYYLSDRLLSAIFPQRYENGIGYQLVQIQKLLAGVVPFGQSTSLSTVPSVSALQANAEIILTLITAQLGFIPAAVLLLLFGFLFIRLFLATFRIKNHLGFITAFGFSCLILVETVTYCLFNLGICFLFTPFYLPFVSYSGTLMVIHMLFLGLALSAYRFDPISKHTSITKKNPFITWTKGKLTFHFDRSSS